MEADSDRVPGPPAYEVNTMVPDSLNLLCPLCYMSMSPIDIKADDYLEYFWECPSCGSTFKREITRRSFEAMKRRLLYPGEVFPECRKDLRKLPVWANEYITGLIRCIEFREGLRHLHAFLSESDCNWFPIWNLTEDRFVLYRLFNDAVRPVCSLGRGDVLFVGRAKHLDRSAPQEDNNTQDDQSHVGP